MATGDAVTGFAQVAAGAYLTYQPSAGVSAFITNAGSGSWTGTTPNKTPQGDVYLTDGSNYILIAPENETSLWQRLKLFVDNTNYLAVKNNDTGNNYVSYSGVEL